MVKARDLVDPETGIAKLVGDAEIEVTRVAAISAIGPGTLTFAKAASLADVAASFDERTRGAAIVCLPSLAAELGGRNDFALLVSNEPRLSFMKLVERYFPPEQPRAGIHPTAIVDATAEIDSTAAIGPFCFVGPSCRVGPGSILHPHVTLQSNVEIGRNVTVHAGAAIGADGFGYERGADGKLQKFPHLGGVVIEDDVEIGSNTSIDRGTLADTLLCRGCKIDNQIHIAHNVVVGEDAVIIAQAMIGGSVRIGARAWIAPAAVVLNQVSIGADALVGLAAVVTKDVPAGETVIGSPAVPEAEFKANRSALKRLMADTP